MRIASNTGPILHLIEAHALNLLQFAGEVSQFCAAEDVEAANGVVRLARRWDQVIDESFETSMGAWQVFNYDENLTLSLSKQHPHEGAQCLSMAFRPEGKGTGTASGTGRAFSGSTPRVFADGLNMKPELRAFVQCVRDDREPIATGEDGLAAAATVEAIYESIETGQVVTLG